MSRSPLVPTAAALLLCTLLGPSAPRLAAAAEPPAPPRPAAAPAPDEVPPGMALYYFVLLKRGPKWTPEVTAATQAIQAGHMANIQKMAADGKLVMAGPFLDDGDLRGIFVFRVATAEEAKSLMDGDPAVQAGRLVGEIHPWMTDARVINTHLDPNPPGGKKE